MRPNHWTLVSVEQVSELFVWDLHDVLEKPVLRVAPYNLTFVYTPSFGNKDQNT